MLTNDTNESSNQVSLEELIAYLGEVAAAFETHPDETTRQAALGMLQGIDALHRAAFTRLTAFLNDHQVGHLLIEAAETDRLISAVLNLYDLLPAEVGIRQAEMALARVRPYVESHGGQLDVLDVVEGVVYVHMGGACQGCAGATYTLQRGIRQALEEGFPGFERVVVSESPAGGGQTSSSGFITLEQVYSPPSLLQGPDFRPVAVLDELPRDSLKQLSLNEVPLLLINSADEIYAVGAMCPGSMLPLLNGRLDGNTIVCGWHNERFDIRSGACLDKGGTRQHEQLPIYPVAVQDREIRVAVNVPSRPPVAAIAHE